MRTLRSRCGALLAFGVAAGLVGALAGGAAAGAGERTGTVRLSPAAVPDSWLVTLKTPRPLDVGGLARGLTARYSGTLGRTFGSAVHGFSVRMSEADARRLAADPLVDVVEQNARVQAVRDAAPSAGQLSWGLDRIDQRTLPLDGRYTAPDAAAGVHAYVIDTGIRTTHADFGGRATVGRDVVGDGRDGQDCDGHGTHVAGIVGGSTYGVAKGVQLVAVRTLDCHGGGTVEQVVTAVDWVTAHAQKPAVANLSLAFDGISTTLDAAIKTSIGSGITYAIAAGNGSAGPAHADACRYSPARVADAMTVGASTSDDRRADFSNTGGCVDLFAPGAGVPSDYAGSDTDTATISGTSMAAPYVAGAAALYVAAHPGAGPAEVRAALVGATTPGVLADVPTGTTNALLYVGTQPPGPGPTGSPTASPTASPGTTAPPAGWPGMPGGPPPTTSTPPPGGTAPAPPTGGSTNDTDVAIPDLGTAQSTITVTGKTGRASAALRVSVRIVHPFRGDLAVDLLAPDGRVYRVKAPSAYDTTANFDATITLNASASPAAGTWTLRVRDVYPNDTGYLDRWSLG